MTGSTSSSVSPEPRPAAMDRASFRRWNEAMARKYDPEMFHRHPNRLVRWIEARRVRAIISLLTIRLTDGVLEVGCGAGNILEGVRARMRCGIDLSSFVLSKAKERLGPGGHLQLADAEAIPYRSASLERVFCSEVLEHVQDPRQVMAEMVRVLKPTGVAVVSVPNESLINTLKLWLRRLGLFGLILQSREGYQSPVAMDDEWHVHSFDMPMLHRIIDGAMVIEAVEAVPWRWLPLRYVVRCRPVRGVNGSVTPVEGSP